ncbi:MAG TPA: response regulator [Methylomirabilota bacterium]|nr:response regulator [Methylomirabilota bacterium]
MKSILVIDDDHAYRGALTELLKAGGWSVLEAEDGETGLRLARETRPRIVLCDLLMPRCNGFQVCRALKAPTSSGPRTRVVVTTGSAYSTDRLNALEAGADEYLTKPVKPDALFTLLERLLGADDILRLQADDPKPQDPLTRVRFWGVRGSIPTPGPDTVFYGGNTSCVEVRAEGEIIILDAGTGIRPLGLALAKEFKDRPMRISLLISHTHWDHIQGFPFFGPAYDPKNEIRVLAYEGAQKTLQQTLASQMESAYFPISMQEMPGHIVAQDLKDPEFKIGKVRVETAFLNHPGVCVGYRLQTRHGVVAYLPDNELFQRLHSHQKAHAEGGRDGLSFARKQDEKTISFLRDADIAIMDAQYDAAEYSRHVGWGHSCVDDAVEIALQAGVKHLFLFHHDPTHSDEKIASMVAGARELVAERGGTMTVEAARESLEITLGAAAPVARPITELVGK